MAHCVLTASSLVKWLAQHAARAGNAGCRLASTAAAGLLRPWRSSARLDYPRLPFPPSHPVGSDQDSQQWWGAAELREREGEGAGGFA